MKPYQQQLFADGQSAINGMRAEDQESPYGRIAPLNQAQQTAQNMQIGRAQSGSPLESAAQGYAFNQLQNGGGVNQAAQQSNEYMGYGPRFQEMLSNSNNAIADSFARGTAAQTDARFSNAGAYGGSAWNETQRNNADQLGGMLTSNTNQMLQNQFNQSAGLRESQIGRQAGAFDAMQGRNLQTMGMAPQLAGMDYNNIAQMQAAGDRQYQYQQANLDQLNSDYDNRINFGMNQLDRGLGLLRGVAGNSGMSTMTQPRQSTNWGGMLGGLGMSAMGGLFGGG